MSEVILKLLIFLFGFAFFAYLAFGIYEPLLRRVSELEKLCISLAGLLSSHPDFRDRISISEKKP